MGLDVGIITVRYLERPGGHTYRFAWELAYYASAYGYMHGDGNNWGAFTQGQVLRMLDKFVEEHKLGIQHKLEILAWVKSLPWEGWQDDFDHTANDDEDFDPFLDGLEDDDGGLIELHFNW